MFLAVHNGLRTVECDIGNDYLESKTTDIVYSIAREEFGSHAGKVIVSCKALYGLKKSGTQFHERLSETMITLGYHPSKYDPDLCIKYMKYH